MRRRAALWWLFAAAALLLVALAVVDDRLWDQGGPGIVGFELAWTEGNARDILAEWGEDGREAARLSLWLDFAFMAVYAAFWALAARALGARRIWLLAPLAGVCDFIENVFLHLVLGGAGGGVSPFLAALFATIKFVALAGVVGYAAVALIRRFPKTALFVALVPVMPILVLAYEIGRDTEPAKPDIGRLLPVERGDIHVRVDGPPDGRPLVLIHGFAVSMRWWDAVVPELAREFRVVRVDLLGHGGSDKPTEGYTMEEQAETVGEVLHLLRIEQAPVVGHSMGGAVATALVERFPRYVSRLMMIGTPPDDESLEGGLLADAAYAPVIGPLNHRFIDQRVVRWLVEEGFAPEFDPPRHLAKDIFERTTWSSFDGSSDGLDEYWAERPLHERLRDEEVPVTVVLGEEDRQTRRSVRLYNSAGARTVVMEDLDHSPQVESPSRTAPLIAAFARGS